MAIRPIIIEGDPRLREVSTPIEAFDKRLAKLIKDMQQTVRKGDERGPGAGLAAPQIGVNERVVIVVLSLGGRRVREIVLVNPQITVVDNEKVEDIEGCLSVPEVYGPVERYRSLRVDYQDGKGRSHSLELSDFNARVVQHEVDHLDGILFTDRVKDKSRLLTKEEYEREE